MNAKISSVNLQSIPTAGITIAEGQPVMFAAADGYAAVGTAGSPVYINFVDSARADVMSLQGDPFQDDLAERNTESGQLTGIRGNGVDIGLPADCWNGGVLPAIGEGVTITGGKFDGATIASGTAYYGIVERISGGKAFFCFSSVPSVLTAS
jgi:hypothetical protein